MTKTYGATQKLYLCPLHLHLSIKKEDGRGGWLKASCGFIPLSERDSAGPGRAPAESWCCQGVQSRLHGAVDEVGYELTQS